MQGVLVLHNIRSVHNVGSIFRTADAAGVSNIILSGYTPTPLDRFGRGRKDFSKVSLGAEKTVAWEHVKQIAPALKKLKKEGYKLLAVEQDKKSVSLFDYKPRREAVGVPTKASGKLALILGNEVKGLSKSVLKQADVIVEIPMRGKKESLNVSVAAGVALFTLLK
ncbi:MAG: TrmH family RNA methyltransferase [bacterium]|nr:TrmH family RNA methyltransferase [bacterium]